MANFTKTVSNIIQPLGPAPSTKWGATGAYTPTWGTSKWGEGSEDLFTYFTKYVASSITPTEDLAQKTVIHVVDIGSITESFEGQSETLSQGNWNYVFPKPTTNSDQRYNPIYTSGAVTSQSWTCGTVGGTVWS